MWFTIGHKSMQGVVGVAGWSKVLKIINYCSEFCWFLILSRVSRPFWPEDLTVYAYDLLANNSFPSFSGSHNLPVSFRICRSDLSFCVSSWILGSIHDCSCFRCYFDRVGWVQRFTFPVAIAVSCFFFPGQVRMLCSAQFPHFSVTLQVLVI